MAFPGVITAADVQGGNAKWFFNVKGQKTVPTDLVFVLTWAFYNAAKTN